MRKIVSLLHRHLQRNWLSYSIGFVLFLVTYKIYGGESKLYLIGGDDARLYYIFPYEYLTRYLNNLVTNNFLGGVSHYWSPAAYVPFVLTIYTLKKVFYFLNVQAFMFSLNISIGFLAFFFLSGFWVKKHFIRIVASLIYIFSLYITKTFYSHQLASMYIVSVFPTVFFFFIKYIRTSNFSYLLLSILVYSVTSSTILTYPWYAATLICLLPIIIYELRKNFRLDILRKLFFAMVLFIILNFFWLQHVLFPVFINSGSSEFVSTVVSESFKYDNAQMIISLAELNPPYHQVASYIRTSWSEIYNMNYFSSYGLIVFACFLMAGLFIEKADKKNKQIFVIFSISLLTTMVLVTPNFGRWNLDLFLFLNNKMPFFTTFRNMYDKFSYPMALIASLMIAQSLNILMKRLKKILYLILVFLILCVPIANGIFFYKGLFLEANRIGFSGVFNADYNNLLLSISKLNTTGKYLWLPLNTPSYVNLEDRKSGLYYYGVSPLQILAGASDLTGFTSFSTPTQPKLNGVILELLQKKEYDKIGKIFQVLNIQYIVLNKDHVPEWGKAHFNENNESNLQTDEFYSQILGSKLEDFGSRYSLYKVNNNYLSETFFVTHNEEASFPNLRENVQSERLNEGEYNLSFIPIKNATYLYFQETYSRYWKLVPLDKNVKVVSHESAFNYSNVWNIIVDSNELTGKELHFKLVFFPSRFNLLGYIFSVSGFLYILIYLYVHTKTSLKDKGVSK